MDYLETHHKKKGTPTGTYLMNPNADLYGEPGFDLQPISAFGEKAPTAKSTAMHVTYPKEFKTRDPLYTQSPEKRAVTYGCTNCRHEDISELSKAFPKQDTAIYVDSRLPKDASFLKKMNQKEYGGEIESYRNGGNFNQQYAMGGEVSNYELGGVSVDSGGYLEPISYNPYNDGTGVTSMIKGQSHDEYDSKLGHSGVMINAYGNQVEAERGEFIREVKEGGEVGGNNETAVITGNLVYKNLNNMLDSKYDKYLNKKVKNIHKEIALKDKKLNKLQEKNTEEINNYSPITAQDKLYGATLAAQQFGYDMQYKNNATAANDFTNYQSSINDTAEEHGLVADDLAKGKVKFDKEALKEYAKYGTSIPKAQTGMFTSDLLSII